MKIEPMSQEEKVKTGAGLLLLVPIFSALITILHGDVLFIPVELLLIFPIITFIIHLPITYYILKKNKIAFWAGMLLSGLGVILNSMDFYDFFVIHMQQPMMIPSLAYLIIYSIIIGLLWDSREAFK